jgi:hypothetical protein
MHINRLVEQVLREEAVELLNTLAAHALADSDASNASLFLLPVEEEAWNGTLLLMREIFDAEVLLSEDQDWLSFRILQSFGARDGHLAYQFTPTFAQALST